MKKKLLILPLIAMGALMTIPKEVLVTEAASTTLRIYSSADYIYAEDGDSVNKPAMVKWFEEYYQELTGTEVNVVYETFDTNETMFNELKLGKSQYDLICPSDYMIQRMVREDMLLPFDFTNLENYNNYASPYLVEQLNNIKTTQNGTEKIVGDYMAGYMWGTLGFLYNPTFSKFVDRGLDADTIHSDLDIWSSIWDKKYEKTFQMKDSMRDTYSVGVMKVYEDELIALAENYDQGNLSGNEYHAALTKIFNRCDDETISLVKDALLELKKNWFGLEVDTGKNDIGNKKVGINLAWSGDAVYSMELAEEKNVELYYKVPTIGGNLWFDGWAMPKGANQELAEAFVNFISSPENAAENMGFIGYTPFIAGDDILALTREMHDIRYDETLGDVDLSTDVTDLYSYNLEYFFKDTLVNYPEDATSYVLYSDEINRYLTAQFPTEEEIVHLAVMTDYGTQNEAVIKLWQEIKSNNMELWMIITFSVLGVAIVGVLIFILLKKKGNKNRRKRA